MNKCQAIKKYLASSYIDQYKSIHIALNRVTFIQDTFEIISAQGGNYGQTKKTNHGKIVICYNDVKFDDGLHGMSTEQLRSILLCNLMAQVLRQKKYVFCMLKDIHFISSLAMCVYKKHNFTSLLPRCFFYSTFTKSMKASA